MPVRKGASYLPQAPKRGGDRTVERKHVVVLMGGMSSEHEVSIASGTGVVESLDRNKYDVTAVTIALEGAWKFPDVAPMGIFEAVAHLDRIGTDCVFLALHGPFGEDGRIQGMLDLLGIPYTSSGCAASALALNKVTAKAVVEDVGVRVADHISFDRSAWRDIPEAIVDMIEERMGLPCVLKSPCQGSSLGMAIARSADEIRRAMPDIFAFGDEAMAEEYVAGIEVACAVLDVDPGAPPTALPVIEIRPVSSAFFDYTAKYTPGACEEITPAEISDELRDKVQETAVLAHDALGCDIWSRSDFIIEDDEHVWLELNTIPGMTPTSLYPQAAAAAGIGFTELVGLFVEAAMRELSD